MKICFWIGNAYHRNWGTNKIVALIANELSKKYDVSLVVTERNIIKNYDFYDDNIEIISMPESKYIYKPSKKGFTSLLRSLVRVVNNKTSFFNAQGRVEIMKEAFYPGYLIDNFTDFFKNKQYDVIIASGHEIIWLALFADRLKPETKTIGWQHNSYGSYVSGKYAVFRNKEELLKKYIPNLNAFVMLNPYDADKYKEKLGIDAEYIYNALTLKAITKTDLSQKQFFMAGRFSRQKGVDLLIDAFKLFCKYNNEWTLIIAGDGKQRMRTIKKVWENKIQDRVRLVGFVDNMEKYYLESSVYLMSSRYEGWGLVVPEALEFGLPVIAFDITPMDLMIDTGENGVIVQKFNIKKYAAAMLKLANDESLRKKMGEAAIIKAKEFDIENIVKRWEELLSSV